MYVFWTDWTPVPLIMASSLLMTAAIPLVTILLLRIVTDRATMGRFANGKLTTAVMFLLVIASLAVTPQAGVELWSDR